MIAAAMTLPPYGNHGRVLTAFPGAEGRAVGVVRYGSGKVIVVGTVRSGAETRSRRDDNEDFVLAGYLPDGRRDLSFGKSGIVRTDLGGDEQATDVKVDQFGRILVTGYVDTFAEVGDSEALVARYMPKGRLDSSFGKGGIVRAGRGGALALALDRANRILIAGGTTLNPPLQTGNPWRVVRLMYDGHLDPSFGSGDGEVTGTVFAQSNVATDLTVDRGGRVIFTICGHSAQSPPVFAVGRLRSDGSPDTSFDEDGLTRIAPNDSWHCPYAIARDKRDRMVVAGNGEHRIVAARLRVNGSLDPSFGNEGAVSLDFRGAKVRLGRIAIDSHSRIVLAGRIAPSIDQLIRGPRYAARMLLVKLRADGSRDRRFGADGDIAIRFGAGKTFDSGAADVTIEGGVVYAAGTAMPHLSGSPPARFALTRYPPGGHR